MTTNAVKTIKLSWAYTSISSTLFQSESINGNTPAQNVTTIKYNVCMRWIIFFASGAQTYIGLLTNNTCSFKYFCIIAVLYTKTPA